MYLGVIRLWVLETNPGAILLISSSSSLPFPIPLRITIRDCSSLGVNYRILSSIIILVLFPLSYNLNRNLALLRVSVTDLVWMFVAKIDGQNLPLMSWCTLFPPHLHCWKSVVNHCRWYFRLWITFRLHVKSSRIDYRLLLLTCSQPFYFSLQFFSDAPICLSDSYQRGSEVGAPHQ